QANAAGEAPRVGVHVGVVHGQRRRGAPRRAPGTLRRRSRGDGRGGRVPGRRRRRAGHAGQLRVPRADDPGDRRADRRGLQGRPADAALHLGHDAPGGHAVTATETRIVTQRPRERPDDSWTLAAGQQTGGFPTATKWSFLPAGIEPRYLVVNSDEAEPSTFKDRMLIERDPHQLVEGIAIASFALGVHHAFVYVRGEFALGAERLTKAVAEARADGLVGPDMCGSGFDLDITIHRGAGAYICGEETALLNSLEGDRGMPRIRPPFPAIAGLYAKPTVVNNVETISTLPGIITMGGEAYGALGVERS